MERLGESRLLNHNALLYGELFMKTEARMLFNFLEGGQMKLRRFHRKLVAVAVLACFMTATTACYGPFNLRKV